MIEPVSTCPQCEAPGRAADHIANTFTCDACGCLWQKRGEHQSDVAALRAAVSCGVLDIEVAERVIARLEGEKNMKGRNE